MIGDWLFYFLVIGDWKIYFLVMDILEWYSLAVYVSYHNVDNLFRKANIAANNIFDWFCSTTWTNWPEF